MPDRPNDYVLLEGLQSMEIRAWDVMSAIVQAMPISLCQLFLLSIKDKYDH